MADLFREFWWMLFPISFMALGAFRAWLDGRARLETIRTLSELAAQGREPSAALLAQLKR